jgi:hypothetical protein
MEEEKGLGNLKERDHLQDQGADGRILTIITIIIIIMTDIIGIQARVWSGLIWLRTVLVPGSCEHGYETLDSVKSEDTFDQMKNY